MALLAGFRSRVAESYSHQLFTVLTHPSFFSRSPVFLCYSGNQTPTSHKNIIFNKILLGSVTYCLNIASFWSLLSCCLPDLRSCLSLFYMLSTHGTMNLIGLLFVCEG